ncbi:MAG: hypothetical protein F4066_06635 [Chloroflexi bacterium]|nr:hypothetical protein [Chloroflexota bacterium]MYF81302.1 hypothetical protein [Chloroflexota bacterium]MYI04521.1 hypothetical protein [Chloroflexota bacterium]
MTRARVLTPVGMDAARQFLAEVRANPTIDALPPDELLFDSVHTYGLLDAPDLRRAPLRTRLEAAAYLTPQLAPIHQRIADDAGFWSWLGMYLFAETAPRDPDGVLRLSPLDETFVVNSGESRSYQRRYRHYLWSAWRLQQEHGDYASFLLAERLNSFGDIADRVFSSSRLFNAGGIVQLILTLYTEGSKQKRQFGRAPGGLRHLIRVLDQFERTYDVYGMPCDALLSILPSEFDRWKPAQP